MPAGGGETTHEGEQRGRVPAGMRGRPPAAKGRQMTTTTHEHPRRRRRFAALVGFALLTASLGAGALSLALFTDTESAGGSFTAGKIDLTTNKAVLFSVTGLMPGDTVPADIVVTNSGTESLRYAISTTDDNSALADALTVSVYANNDCSGTALATGAFGGSLLGSSTAGQNDGDRTLAGSSSETLCFAVSLPKEAPTTLESTSASVTFVFDAEQTRNNP